MTSEVSKEQALRKMEEMVEVEEETEEVCVCVWEEGLQGR